MSKLVERDRKRPLALRVQPLKSLSDSELIQVNGWLDHATYLQLIVQAQARYAQGVRKLLLDLRGVAEMSAAGPFALQAIARLFADQSAIPIDQAHPQLHWATTTAIPMRSRQVKVVATVPLAAHLRTTDLGLCLEVFDDLDAALAALSNE